MKAPKSHVPAPGHSAGLRGPALCGREARYLTGDHAMIRQLAYAALREGCADHYCARCMARLRAEVTR